MRPEQYLIWACVILLLVCLFCFFRWKGRKRTQGGQRQFIREALDSALSQKSGFDIKLENGLNRAGLSATLISFSPTELAMQVNGFVADEWDKKPVEVFFRVIQPEGPVFHVFNSFVSSLEPGANVSSLTLTMPEHLRVEKKRHFVRVSPDPKDILMIAVWPVAPGRRLPRANSDLGAPAARWKNGESDEQVQLENISGGGIALRFQPGEKGELPFPSARGRQLICLLVYRPAPDAEKPVIFWCSGEIMSVRRAGYALSLGLEFTNWAVQTQGDGEIHWTHSSPWQGAKPVLNWVAQIDK